MASKQTTLRVPGKWILAGEHAVVRGRPAVALPHPDHHLTLRFADERSSPGLTIWPTVLTELLMQLLSQLEAKCGLRMEGVRGSLFLDSTIPLQAGFGSSAALCTAITRWFSMQSGIDPERVTPLATELENYFHGKSSGLDVAVVSMNAPILYQRGKGSRPLDVRRLPRFTFHDTGLRSSTRESITKVESLIQSERERGIALDDAMGASAESAAEALQDYARDPQSALERLAQAMNGAQDCFQQWGLMPPEAESIALAQRERGALAVKLTGAGNGGFLVALWPD